MDDPPGSLPENLKEIWSECAKNVSGAIGQAGIESLVIQVHRMRSARARVEKEGMIVKDGNGNPVPHPCLAIERAAGAEVRSWMKRFGRAEFQKGGER